MRRVLGCCLLGIVGCVTVLTAAEIDSEISTRETYVGLPVVLRITINNAIEHETPEMPEVEGLKIESAGPPSRSRQITNLNGRRTQRTTVTYPFLVTPLREGSFTIPPVKVVADGIASITKAVRIVATQSQTDDLIFVEIEGSEKEIYVGEAIQLTLKIWVRPYRNQTYRIALDEEEMWYCLSDRTSWGPFQEPLEELAQRRQRPGGKRVLREDSAGEEREYFLYELETTLYPDRPTTIDGDDVRLIMNYPEELGRSRSPFDAFGDDDFFSGSVFDDPFFRSFGNRLTITKTRPVVAEAAIDPIVVRPVPSQGRPDNYVGAVGQYTIAAEATPNRAQAGEPITLSLAITGSGSMDVVRAPPLSRQPDLTRDFKVSDESLAGVVSGSTKVFTTTIRPLHDKVKAIPAIEYSYFDPDLEQFITVTSDPIPIEVQQADVLALDAIVGTGGSRRRLSENPSQSDRVPTTTDAPALFSGPDVLVSIPPRSWWSPARLTMLALPPALFLLLVGFKFRSLPGSWISARRQFQRSLQSAHSTSDVAVALETFLRHRFRLAPGRLSRDQTLGALRAAGRHDLAIRVDRIYQAESSSDAKDLETSRRDAAEIADEVGARAAGQIQDWRSQTIRSTTTTVSLFLAVASLQPSHAIEAAEISLNDQQRRLVLQEAIDTYESAISLADAEEANEAFRQSADKFRLLVDSGVVNDGLYFNLAEASRRSGQLGQAIANYRRALRLDPDHAVYVQRLEETEQLAGITASENASLTVERIRRLNRVALRWLGPASLLALFLVAWIGFWMMLSLRVVRPLPAWKTMAALLLAASVVAAGSYALHLSEFLSDSSAVLVSDSIPLRSGDGDQFPELATIDGAEGEQVRLIERRDDWLHVLLPDGRRGWIAANHGEVI